MISFNSKKPFQELSKSDRGENDTVSFNESPGNQAIIVGKNLQKSGTQAEFLNK